jgi:hypothetical protein
METIPAVSMALFAGHIVDQRKRKASLKCTFRFGKFWLILVTLHHQNQLFG